MIQEEVASFYDLQSPEIGTKINILQLPKFPLMMAWLHTRKLYLITVLLYS